MQGHVRAGGLRDVDHKDEEQNVGLEEHFVGSYRAEERESGSNCPGMVSRTQKNTDPASNSKTRKPCGIVQICCYTNSKRKEHSKVAKFLLNLEFW